MLTITVGNDIVLPYTDVEAPHPAYNVVNLRDFLAIDYKGMNTPGTAQYHLSRIHTEGGHCVAHADEKASADGIDQALGLLNVE